MQMEMSIEMKIQALDKMIEMRNQMVTVQDNLGVYNGFNKNCGILIYSTEDFLEIAKHVSTSIASRELKEIENVELSFNYNGTEFHTFVLLCEYEAEQERIHRHNKRLQRKFERIEQENEDELI